MDDGTDGWMEKAGSLLVNGWLDGMDDGTDGWMEKASRKTITTSFTICNSLGR
jgi:hypothetical protein